MLSLTPLLLWAVGIFTLLLFASSCTTTEIITVPSVTRSGVTLQSGLLGGTEGYPRTTYAFKALHPTTIEPIEYHWNFDESDFDRVVRGRDSISYTFNTEGSYRVRVRLVNYETRRILAEAMILVNIRGTELPKFDLRRVPAGTFTMGSTIDFTESPPRLVTISRAFLVTATEITNKQWRTIYGSVPSLYDDDSLPVHNVSWLEAVDFCNRLSVRSGLEQCYTILGTNVTCDFTKNGYRLPTEAEWEYMARGATTTQFYTGDPIQIYSGCTNNDSLEPIVDSIAWHCLNSNATLKPVGRKKPNIYGIYDAIGNASEWVWDYITDAATQPSGTDPTGPANGIEHIVRGGNIQAGVFDCRVSDRRRNESAISTSDIISLRIVKNAP